VHPEPDSGGGAAQDYLIESFFLYDAEPLSGTDVERAFKLLDWGRQDLLDAVRGLSQQQLDENRPGERWSINGILNHVAHAEWWYQERLGMRLPDREDDLPADPLGALELVRAHFNSVLPKQVGVHHALDVGGERWSPRKMLRRAAWHERDHTQHIRKLL
jgi:DinB family protein